MEQEKNQLIESLALIAKNKHAKISRIKKLKRNQEEREKKSDLVPFYFHDCSETLLNYYSYELCHGIIVKVLGNYQFTVFDQNGVKCHASLPSSLHHHKYHGLDIGNIVSLRKNELVAHPYEYFICGKVDQHYLTPYEITEFQSYLTDNKTFKQFCRDDESDIDGEKEEDEEEEEEKEEICIKLSVMDIRCCRFSTLFISQMKEKFHQIPPTLLKSTLSQMLYEKDPINKKILQNSRKSLKIGIISFFILLCTLHDINTLESQQDVHYITTTLLRFSPYNKIGMLLYQMFYSSYCSLPSKKLIKQLPIELSGEIMSYLNLEELLLYFTSFLFKSCASTNQLKYFLNLQYMGKRRLKKLFKNIRFFDRNEINSAMKNEQAQDVEEESCSDEEKSEEDSREESQRINESWYDGDHDIRTERYRIENFERKDIHNEMIDLKTENHLKALLDSRIPYYMSVFCFSTEFPLM